MKRRSLDLLTMCDVFVAALLLIIITPINVQAVYKRIYLHRINGTFSSPNYPSPYPSDIYYEWVMPWTSKKLQIEFVELDLYDCYVGHSNRHCDSYDYVHISMDHKFYCNWNKPTSLITFPSWTNGIVTFYSSDSIAQCKGRGFKASYRPVDPPPEPSTSWPTTTTTTPIFIIPTTKSSGTESSESERSKTLSNMLWLLILLVLPLILILACFYWCCRKSSRPTVNQDVLQTSINAGNYQTPTPVGANNRGYAVGPTTHQNDRLLTVNLPVMPRTGHCDNIAQTTQLTPPGAYSVQRQANNNALPGTVAHDPPPSYDDVWESNDLNQVHTLRFQSPPSYEDVIRESTQSRENLSQGPVDSRGYAGRYHNDMQGDIRGMMLESNISNESNSGPRRLEIVI